MMQEEIDKETIERAIELLRKQGGPGPWNAGMVNPVDVAKLNLAITNRSGPSFIPQPYAVSEYYGIRLVESGHFPEGEMLMFKNSSDAAEFAATLDKIAQLFGNLFVREFVEKFIGSVPSFRS